MENKLGLKEIYNGKLYRGSVTYTIYVNIHNKDKNILEISDKLNNKKEFVLQDMYVLRLMRLIEHHRYANDYEMVRLINFMCRKLNLDLDFLRCERKGDL